MAKVLLASLMLLNSSYAMDPTPGPVDEVAAPTVTPDDDPPAVLEEHPGWPFGGAFAQRLWCIEEHESQHSPYAVNRYSGAKGLLQWLDSTARAWGVQIGNRTSEWSAAAAMHALGESFFRSQWPVTARLCP
jgi:transglycosylase-like protein with SLT domain